MNMLIIQSLILVALAYLAGCIVGSFLKKIFGSSEQEQMAVVGAANSEVAKPALREASNVAEKAPVTSKEPEAEPVALVSREPEASEEPQEEVETPAEAEEETGEEETEKEVPANEEAEAEETGEEQEAEAEEKQDSKASEDKKPSKRKTKDDLTRIKGIGPVIERKLNAIGVESYSQIASWRKLDRDAFSEKLSFKGRIERDNWVPQARVLADGRETEYSKQLDRKKAAAGKPKPKQVKNTGKPRIYRKEPASGKDKLTQINGIGNALEQKLIDVGIYKIRQIAGWSQANQTWIGKELGFPGRVQREKWVDQAKKLSGLDTKKPKAKRPRKPRQTKKAD
ncbi:MAG: helix-hairpin-helix domain-containing protein [Pseudomonadota bacterium]